MSRVRPAAVAGSFYPAEANRLERDVRSCLERAAETAAASIETEAPKAIVAPHAGYPYSGPIAGSAFAGLGARRGEIERVVILGPSHYFDLEGIATSGSEAHETPLGRVEIDCRSEERIERLPGVRPLPEAHRPEHAVEVELPFLQLALGRFRLVALLVGRTEREQVAKVLDELWGGDETLIVVSSDLSHFLDYESARALDRETSERVLEGRTDLDSNRACGFRAWNAVTEALSERGLRGRLLDLRNSGDTAGPRDRVVGYGAFAFA